MEYLQESSGQTGIVKGFEKFLKKNDRKSDLIFLFVLLAVSLGLNVVQGVHSKSESQFTSIVNSEKVSIGESLRPFSISDQSGRMREVDFDRPTVLYFFSPSCRWCESTNNNVNAIAAARGKQYHILGIALSNDHLERYLGRQKLSFDVYRDITLDTALRMNLGVTPEIIVVGKGGRVLHNWVGTLAGDARREAENEFHVSLDGVSK